MNTRDWKRHVALAVTLVGLATVAVAIPPPPPAQKGSKVSTYTCPSGVLTFTERWNTYASPKWNFGVSINGKDVSDSDLRKITEEIASIGPFQANFVVCTNSGIELILLRYTPSAAHLHLGFSGQRLARVGVSNASTGFKLVSRPMVK